MATIGYARVSTTAQELAMLLNALAGAGLAPLVQGQASGVKANRPGRVVVIGFVRERERAGLEATASRSRRDGRKTVFKTVKLRRAGDLLARRLTAREAAAQTKVGKTPLFAEIARRVPGSVAEYRR